MDAKFEFFLGGHDLEMLTIRRLLESVGGLTFHDHQLGWGAKASAYRNEIENVLASGRTPVFVELQNDMGLAESLPCHAGQGIFHVVVVDHHNERSGSDVPTSLEQVFALLERPAVEWSRWYALVAANDRGYVSGMKAAGATQSEIRQVRDADRLAQGITPEQEQIGREAACKAETRLSGQLKIVRLPHSRSATVTDVLTAELGGPGYENLVIYLPSQTLFFGSGWVISHLKSRYPGGWCGGELPASGFWGIGRKLDEQPLLELLEKVMSTKSAKEIEVKAFRHIAMLPVLLRGQPIRQNRNESTNDFLQPWVDEFVSNGWEDKTPGYSIKGECPGEKVGSPIPKDFTFEQMVYFHPFVRDFLFGDGSSSRTERPTRFLSCSKISALEAELGKWQPEGVQLRLNVTRTELFLFKPCVAILMVEVAEPRYLNSNKPVTLDVIQDFQDQFRRIYPPFFWDGHTAGLNATEAGLCLRSLKWFDTAGSEIPMEADGLAIGTPMSMYDEFTRQGAEPPMFEHWRWFFGNHVQPLRCQHQSNSPHCPQGLRIQQLLDERMTVMSYFGFDNPEDVSTGDQDRLTFVDASGTDAFPYNETFLADRRSRHTYERFAHYGTRYFCSGYGFAMIGTVKDPNLSKHLQNHFSRHYFCLGLIAQYQKAALLYFADEMSSAIKGLGGKSLEVELSSPDFLRNIEEIQHRFLKFRSRSFFPEVTNQMQGRELFQLWFDVLETQKLFDLVDSSSERLTSVLAERESRQLSRVAANSIPVAIAISVASLMLTASQLWNNDKQAWSIPLFGWIVICIVTLVSGVLTHKLLRFGKLDAS